MLRPHLAIWSWLIVVLAGSAVSQDPTYVPPGYVLVDDMILPEEVVVGEATFTATPWTSNVVPYEFAANVTPANQIIARKAMAEVSAVCGVIFIPNSTIPNRVRFNASTVNNSAVGMIGGVQIINITSWAVKYIVVHEIMHALGFLHEQQRPDRDNFVTINWGNISQTGCPGSGCTILGSSCACNFDIVNTAATPTTYDFLSIMHYGRTAFTSNGADTITCNAAFAGFQNQLGNRNFMTFEDAAGLQSRYGLSLLTPSVTSISPPFVTTATGTFTLHVYGADFHEGSPNGNGVQGSRITWNGAIIPTTYEDDGHLSASIPATMISSPGQVQISVTNPAPGLGPALVSLPLTISCQAGSLGLAVNVPTTVTNGCQNFFIAPQSNTANVVALSSISDWNMQMGPAVAAAGGNETDFLVGGGWFGPGTVTPTSGSLTLGSGFSPARLVHLTSSVLNVGQPTLASIPVGANARAFHHIATGVGYYTLQVAGPTNLRWKLIEVGQTFGWRSSETQIDAQGTVGGGPVSGISMVNGAYALVVYKNGSALTSPAGITISLCFDFTPAPVSAGATYTLNQGTYACGPFALNPQVGKWNVIGVSSPSDWDIQVGAAASQFGGNTCDYVLANGHFGSLSPLIGVSSPFSVPGSPGEVQFGTTTTVPSSLGSQGALAADVLQAFEFEVLTPGNYDIRVSATGYQWDLHAPGVSSSWRRATDRIAGPLAPATWTTIPNLDVGWHCVVVYHNGGVGAHGLTHSVNIVYSSVQAPVMGTISPTEAAAGSGPLTLYVYGSGFLANSEVRWNGSPLSTTYVSDTELEATVDASYLNAPGSASVTVATPNAGSSAAAAFTIGNPVPTIISMTPDYEIAGAPTLSFSVIGTDFAPGCEVVWDYSYTSLPTTYVSSTQLDAVIDASLLRVSTAYPVYVINPGPGGGVSSPGVFVVYFPQVTALTPATIPLQTPSAAPIPITVNGIFFAPWSVVYANGVALPTTYVDLYTLDATLDPNLFSQSQLPGAFSIAVGNSIETVSNQFPLVVDSGSNAGLIGTLPVAPEPTDAFALYLEGGAPLSPVSLIVDAGSPTPLGGFPDPTTNLVLGVTEAAGSTGLWLPLVDGLGVFGPADGTTYDLGGNLTLAGFVRPTPALGLSLTLQAVYLDLTAPLGIQLTWPRHTLDL